MKEKDRDYVFRHLPVQKQDWRAYDEGYYYDYCKFCDKTTEHEVEICCECRRGNSDKF